jgi:hypothetical protein
MFVSIHCSVIRTVDFKNQQKLNSNLIFATAFTTCSWRLLTCLWRDEGMARILTDELSVLQGNNFRRGPAQLLFNTKKTRGCIQWKTWCMGPYAWVEYNSTYLRVISVSQLAIPTTKGKGWSGEDLSYWLSTFVCVCKVQISKTGFFM